MDISGKEFSELIRWAAGKVKERCCITAAYQGGDFTMEAVGDKANLFALGCGILKELAKNDPTYEAKDYVDAMAMTIKMELEEERERRW